MKEQVDFGQWNFGQNALTENFIMAKLLSYYVLGLPCIRKLRSFHHLPFSSNQKFSLQRFTSWIHILKKFLCRHWAKWVVIETISGIENAKVTVSQNSSNPSTFRPLEDYLTHAHYYHSLWTGLINTWRAMNVLLHSWFISSAFLPNAPLFLRPIRMWPLSQLCSCINRRHTRCFVGNGRDL